MALWKAEQGGKALPERIIPCPLGRDELDDYYSIDSVATRMQVDLSSYKKQQQAQRGYLSNPHLNKEHGDKGANQKKLAPASIIARERDQSQFTGFCIKHLGMQPTLELVMQPHAVAKFVVSSQQQQQAQQKMCSALLMPASSSSSRLSRRCALLC